MIKKYIPNKCYKTIFDIDFDNLKENGIHGLLFDIDNTILPYGILDPEEKHINFINLLKEKGFKVCLISNNNSKRVDRVGRVFNVPGVSRAFKPKKRGYLKAAKLLNIDFSNLAMIGDQMLTDIKGANNTGIYSILVKTIVLKNQKWYTKINRIREKSILKKIKKIDNDKYNSLMEEVYNSGR